MSVYSGIDEKKFNKKRSRWYPLKLKISRFIYKHREKIHGFFIGDEEKAILEPDNLAEHNVLMRTDESYARAFYLKSFMHKRKYKFKRFIADFVLTLFLLSILLNTMIVVSTITYVIAMIFVFSAPYY